MSGRPRGVVHVVVAVVVSVGWVLGVTAGPPAVAAPLNSCWSRDNGDAVVTELSLSRGEVDVTDAARTVGLRVRVRDLGGPGPASGVKRVQAQLRSHTWQLQTRTLKATSKDFRTTFTVPRGGATGTWTLTWVSVTDKAGNTAEYSSPQLAARGFPTEVAVTGTPDVKPPVLTGLTFSQLTPVDATQGAVDLTVTATVPDDVSGTRRVLAGFLSPTLSKAASVLLRPVPGTVATYSGVWRVGPYFGTSTWQLSLDVADKAGNQKTYGPPDLSSQSLPWQVQVTAGSDVTAPVVASTKVDTKVVDVRQGARTVVVTARLTDAGAGVHSAGVVATGPVTTAAAEMKRVAGTVQNGVWRATLVFRPCQGSPGTVALRLGVYDEAANYLSVDLPALPMKGADRKPPAPRLVFFHGQPVPHAGPLVVDFDEAVNGVSPQSLRVSVDGSAAGRVKGTWTCQDSHHTPTSCRDGVVRRASFTPAAPFSDGIEYDVTADPPGTLALTDLAGNPPRRWSSGFGTTP
ncbi:hypothetical protein [Nocardioides sp.]|uniref:hypothetical protein n=1 Tax=Nocardioides sp. TaxID=35761 RepID=UPI003783628D